MRGYGAVVSNWRINVGVGPLRYVRALGGGKAKSERQGTSPLGCLVSVVVVVGLVYLCCWGGVAWMNGQQ